MSSLRNKALSIAQRYCGMTPKDLGVETYAQMQEKMADEIVSLASKNNILLVGAGDIGADMAIAHMAKSANMNRDFTTIDIHDFKKQNSGFGITKDCNYLLSDVAKINTEDLIVKTKKLKSEVDEMEVQGVRGITNNRKIKVRKKAKNGKKNK